MDIKWCHWFSTKPRTNATSSKSSRKGLFYHCITSSWQHRKPCSADWSQRSCHYYKAGGSLPVSVCLPRLCQGQVTVKKESSSPEPKASEQPAPQLQPQTFPSSSSSPSPSRGQSSQIVNPSDLQTETLSAMDVSDFLSLQSPETPSNIIPIEALLQGEEEIGLNSSFSK